MTIHMKVSLVTVVFFGYRRGRLAGAALRAQNESAPLFVGHDDMKTKFESGALVAEASTYRITASHRDGPGRSEVHETVTDIFHVTDGHATVVLGGELVGAR